jgi:hypothetical protein
MLIARQKRKENIAEYLLYMFQIEDIIRAHKFDLDRIDTNIISRFELDYNTRREMREWYKSLIGMMNDNQLQEKGHIPLLQGLIREISDLHLNLLNNDNEKEYRELYDHARPAIEELKGKSGDPDSGDIEVSLNGLYGLLLLKLQKKTVNPETEKAFGHISRLMAHLSQHFHAIEEGNKEAKG